jgi:uncharacterized protein (DUF305 family)
MPRHTSFLAALGLVLLLLGAACTQTRSAQTGATTATTAPFDQQFIDMMVPHHQGALEMARIAEVRSQRPEVKALAADILRTQNAEIEQMKAWRKAWYGSDETPPMSRMPMVDGMVMETPAGGGMAGHGSMGAKDSAKPAAKGPTTMDMAADVEGLRSAPEPFDRAFIDAMIPHHESAIAAARAAESRAERSEIKELAKAIIAEQEREVGQLRQWRQAWFPA